jgi:glucose/arabinose dehydrogenase
MKRRAIFFTLTLSAAAGLASCGGGSSSATLTPPQPTSSPAPAPAPAPANPSTEVPTLSRTVVMTGLQNPWDIAFTPDGAMLYTERSRGLSVRRANGTTAQLFRPNDLVAQGQSGMQGVTIDPAFASNRTIYVYMSSNAGGQTDNRVVRMTVDDGYSTVANRNDIVTGISYKSSPLAGDPQGQGAHNGGRIRFGPDNICTSRPATTTAARCRRT